VSPASGAELEAGLSIATNLFIATNQRATQAAMKPPNSSSRVDVDTGWGVVFRNHGKLH
jgi:hypothetical protein